MRSAARKRKQQRAHAHNVSLPFTSEDTEERIRSRGWRPSSRISRTTCRSNCVFGATLLSSLLLFALAIDTVMTHFSISSFPIPITSSATATPLEDATIAIVSIHSGFKYALTLGNFFRTNKRAYADAHGYAYTDAFPQESQLAPLESSWQREKNRHLYYQKPRFVLHVMERYTNLEWVLWVDGDSIFTQYNIRIEDRIKEFQKMHTRDKDEMCFVWAKDSAPNAGVLLLRNLPATRALLRASLTTFEDTDFFRKFTDQASLTTAVERNETYRNCQLLLDDRPTLLQSRVRGPSRWLWQSGHWILHLPNHNRLELLSSLKAVGKRLKESPPPVFQPLAMPKLDTLSQERRKRFQSVQDAIRHAWTGYASVCLHNAHQQNRLAPHIPADDLSPVAGIGNDWLHHAATLHDSLDTLVIAGLHEEYQSALSLVLQQDLQATALQPTKIFEYHLRCIGGLLGAFSLTGDARLLFRAKDAADALLQSPFQSSPTVLPRMYDVLFPPRKGGFPYKLYSRLYQWGRDAFTNEHHFNSLAGVGSFALEFHYLSQVLGQTVYREKANEIFEFVAKHQQHDGLVPGFWNVMTGTPTSTRGSLGSGSDSFYEYLLKLPLMACDKDRSGHLSCEKDSTLQSMRNLYEKVVRGALRSKHIMRGSEASEGAHHPLVYPVENGNRFHHLLCFLPGLVALGAANLDVQDEANGDESRSAMGLAKEMFSGCQYLYEQSPTGLGPEEIGIKGLDAGRQPSGDHRYLLRPEHVESIFVLYRLTGDEKYQEMGWRVFESIERYCRTEKGYTGLSDVYDGGGGKRIDDMPSYFIAETLKYLLLLFAPNDYISLDEFVFTTEAHPLRRQVRNYVLHTDSSEYAPAAFPWLLWLVIIIFASTAVTLASLVRHGIRCSPKTHERRKSS